MKPLLSIMMMSACGAAMVACTHAPMETITTTTAMPSDAAVRATVQAVYDGFAVGDMDMVTRDMSDAIVWNEAQGNPYADLNPYVGPNAVLSGLFSRIGGEWDYFTADPIEFIMDVPRVAVIGHYKALYTATGETLDAPFVHVWTVQNGEITTFQQYTDTHAHVTAMGG
ncbi:hypothetical protein GCM10009069_10220 [Algimonas arctica]|uniref:SnoaL-like domain-containing protein n=1 Tax=Algimonas arctica TaxID=1479486 RepID=A0A8J3CP19_9PROT|nr:nuclear transport factor 2 family protein [Algimonas arctica]GHA89112.1 hypothetical protein GCM10009069_10220 [Algimonas arctica]